ncbi:MAG: AtpZ/AtpI family protein [Gemmataceae bacterium]
MADSENPRQLGLLFAMAQVGFEMVAFVVLGILLDRWWDSGPWMLVVGAAMGLFGGLYHLVVLLNRSQNGGPPSP